MSNHFVQHLLQGGDTVKTTFTCTEPENSPCRTACKTCYDEGEEHCICNSLDKSREPNLVDLGYCMTLEWLKGDPEESYDGKEDEPVRGPEPQPITTSWEGDYYTWKYAK